VIGNYLSLKGRHERAWSLRRALRLRRTYLSAWTLMGHEYRGNEEHPAAIEAYRNAVDICPTDYRAWYGLGQTSTRSSRFPTTPSVTTQVSLPLPLEPPEPPKRPQPLNSLSTLNVNPSSALSPRGSWSAFGWSSPWLLLVYPMGGVHQVEGTQVVGLLASALILGPCCWVAGVPSVPGPWCAQEGDPAAAPRCAHVVRPGPVLRERPDWAEGAGGGEGEGGGAAGHTPRDPV